MGWGAAAAGKSDVSRLLLQVGHCEHCIHLVKQVRAARVMHVLTRSACWFGAQRQLLDQMARLSGEQYEQAIAIILARYPGATQNVGEELNLDLSVADALTLRQLQHFCHMCLTPADPPPSWPGLLVGTGGPDECLITHQGVEMPCTNALFFLSTPPMIAICATSQHSKPCSCVELSAGLPSCICTLP